MEMKKRYSIGFFCFACCALLLLTAVYQIRYRKAYEEVERLEAQLAEAQRQKEKSISADGTAKKENGYFLREKNGYLVVYLADGETFYESTGIRTESLPEKLLEEIRQGKYIETTKELYGFLENYSS
jgi:hypothetical protein